MTDDVVVTPAMRSRIAAIVQQLIASVPEGSEPTGLVVQLDARGETEHSMPPWVVVELEDLCRARAWTFTIVCLPEPETEGDQLALMWGPLS